MQRIITEIVKNLKETATLVSHGFEAGDVIRVVSGSWEKALAAVGRYTGVVGVVDEVFDADSFSFVLAGRINLTTLPIDFVIGQTYYLSADIPGKLTAYPSSDAVQIPIFVALDNYGSGIVVLSGNSGTGTGFITSPHGYVSGGILTGSTYTNTYEGFKFSDASVKAVSATLSLARNWPVGFSSLAVGYTYGGYDSSNYTRTIDFLSYVDETAFNSSAITGRALKTQAGGFSSAEKGYSAGGTNGTQLTQIEGFSFEATKATILSAVLGAATTIPASNLHSTERGWIGGGYVGTSNVTATRGIRFDTEAAVTGAALSVARRQLVGFSSDTKGYCCGGYTTVYVDTVDGILLADWTAFTGANTLSATWAHNQGISDEDYGYLLGGIVGGTSFSTTCGSLKFSDEGTATITATLATGRQAGTGLCPRTFLT